MFRIPWGGRTERDTPAGAEELGTRAGTPAGGWGGVEGGRGRREGGLSWRPLLLPRLPGRPSGYPWAWPCSAMAALGEGRTPAETVQTVVLRDPALWSAQGEAHGLLFDGYPFSRLCAAQ